VASRCRQVLLGLLALCAFVGQARASSSTVVISQVYSATAANASLRTDFVELLNLARQPVILDGWTVQVSSQNNNTWSAVALSGTLAPGQYLLVSGQSSSGGIALPVSDVVGSFQLDATGGRVALSSTSTQFTGTCPNTQALIDLLNYGSANCGSAAPALAGTLGLIRAGGGCVDSDNSSRDFTLVPPYPRTTASAPNLCGTADAASLTSYVVPANGGVSMVTQGAASTITVGSAKLEPSPNSPTPAGFAIFGFRENGTLVSEASVPLSQPIQSGLLYAELNGPVNTGIAFANPNDTDTTVMFNFNNSNLGYLLPSDFGTLTIPAHGQIARFVNELPYSLPGGFQGVFQFTSTAPVSVIALRGFTNERGEFLVTTLPVIDSSIALSTAPAYLAHFAAGGGWLTEIILVNASGATVTGTIDFRDPSGQAATIQYGTLSSSSLTYSLPAFNSQTLQISGAGANPQTGSVHVSLSSGPATPVAVGIFAYVNQNVRVSEAGLVGVGGSAFRTYVETSGGPGAIGSIQSGLAIANIGNNSTTVNLALMQLDGTSTGLSASISIAASGQVAKFLGEFFPTLPSSFKGILRVSTIDSIALVGLRGRYNERGDFLITTVPPANEATPAPAGPVVFPHIADSGGYTTQFVLFGSTGLAGKGNLHTFTPGGQPLALQFN